MTSKWLPPLVVILLVLAASFFLGIPLRWWIPIFAPAIGVFLLLLPFLSPQAIVGALSALKLKRAAARYAAWNARRHPFPEARDGCTALAAIHFYDLGDYKQAEEYAERGIRQMENKIDVKRVRLVYALCLNVKGVLALDRGLFQEALRAFYRPLRMHLEHPILVPIFQSNCASAFYDLGEWESGLDYARRAVASKSLPTVTLLAHNNAAQILAEMGQTDEALTHAQTAASMKVPPIYRALALAVLGWLRGRKGDTAGANQAFDEADRLTRNLPSKEAVWQRFVLFRRGQFRFETENWDAAERDLRASISGDEVQPGALFYLAELARRRGDEAQATQWRERLQREVPESFYARRAAAGIIVPS